MKNKRLHQWLWKWHFVAGILSLPFVLVLSITGGIYLFKAEVEAPVIAARQSMKEEDGWPHTLSLEEQWRRVAPKLKKGSNTLVIPIREDQQTSFTTGRFSGETTFFVHPVTGQVTGQFSPKETWMYTVRKLHGELLGGKLGTKIVELVASWMLVLILTGLYIWFPFSTGSWAGVFTIRYRQTARIFYRDLHAVTGFWLSLLLVLLLAGGLPWTDVFGSNFKRLQNWTNTGYPATWHGIGLASSPEGNVLTIDSMVRIAKQQQLSGSVRIGLPKDSTSSFSVFNKTPLPAQRKMLHFDQYTGQLLKAHDWEDVGMMMRGRAWVMAFHQGELGRWNWWLMFLLALALTMMSAAAILSYGKRKPVADWGVPAVPARFTLGKGIIALLVLLGLVLPLFGLSLLLILGTNRLKKN